MPRHQSYNMSFQSVWEHAESMTPFISVYVLDPPPAPTLSPTTILHPPTDLLRPTHKPPFTAEPARLLTLAPG